MRTVRWRAKKHNMLAVLVCLSLSVAATGCGSSSGGAVATDESTSVAGDSTSTTVDSGETTDSATVTSVPVETALGDQSGDRVGDEMALLSEVRVAAQDGFDRVVFEFMDDQLPEWSAGYQDPPFLSDGEGAPITVAGDAHLVVTMRGASGYDLDNGVPVYEGPETVPGNDAKTVIHVLRQGDFEGQMSWIIDTKKMTPFKVTPMKDPARLVIDLSI